MQALVAPLAAFAANGYAVVEADDRAPLDAIREAVFACAREAVSYRGETAVDFLNDFASYGLSPTEFNELRLRLVECLSEIDATRLLYDAFHRTIATLVGCDVAAQKVPNIVVQQPGDRDQVPVHRDAPSNSHFEAVVWTPLVDCYGSKSMYACDRARSAEGVAMLRDGSGYAPFAEFVAAHGTDLNVPYGSAFVFAAGIAHGCKVNTTAETRWAVNIRYKNVFSPYGNKGLAEFFRVLELSPLSRVALEFEHQEFG